MSKCPQCGDEHDLLDPTFLRPDAYVDLDDEQREDWARSDDDLCRIALPDQPMRQFVRCVLPVEVEGREDGIAWGFWAEVDDDSFQRVIERWSDEQQHEEPPFAATIANDVPGHDTLSLPVKVQLTGPESRPHIQFDAQFDHPFANACRRGVSEHQAAEWIERIDGSPLLNDFDERDLGVFVCQQVFDGAPILRVTHDADDGAWQFLCGGDHEGEEPRIVGVGHLLDRDASLYELGEVLEPGECADRDSVDEAWQIEANDFDDDEDEDDD